VEGFSCLDIQGCRLLNINNNVEDPHPDPVLF
jgi:hypothetical protein